MVEYAVGSCFFVGREVGFVRGDFKRSVEVAVWFFVVYRKMWEERRELKDLLSKVKLAFEDLGVFLCCLWGKYVLA